MTRIIALVRSSDKTVVKLCVKYVKNLQKYNGKGQKKVHFINRIKCTNTLYNPFS